MITLCLTHNFFTHFVDLLFPLFCHFNNERKVRKGVALGGEKKNSCTWETLNLSTCEQNSTKKIKMQNKNIAPVACSLWEKIIFGGKHRNPNIF